MVRAGGGGEADAPIMGARQQPAQLFRPRAAGEFGIRLGVAHQALSAINRRARKQHRIIEIK
ncbi:MAG: hypothetical protein KDJ65_28940 [Anaerolineae bacterium]|nr:hypothetical protein [Anaerolineae bacterium]